MPTPFARRLWIVPALTALVPLAISNNVAAQDRAAGDEQLEVVVTGTRVANRTATDTAVPTPSARPPCAASPRTRRSCS
jgi:hypothetical protein